MRKTTILFAILTMSVSCAAVNFVCNSSFEIDVDPVDGVPDGWGGAGRVQKAIGHLLMILRVQEPGTGIVSCLAVFGVLLQDMQVEV